MIGFIQKFLNAMSDEELSYFQGEVWRESEKRASARRKQFGSGMPELNAHERGLARQNKIEAIKAYRIRTGAYLKQAKDEVEDYLVNRESYPVF